MRDLAMDMARQGQHVEVLEPSELRAAVKAELKQAQRQLPCTPRMLGAHNLRPSVSGTWLEVTHQKLHVPRQAHLPVGGSVRYFHQSANSHQLTPISASMCKLYRFMRKIIEMTRGPYKLSSDVYGF